MGNAGVKEAVKAWERAHRPLNRLEYDAEERWNVVLRAARELEWAEAYVGDHPHCALGAMYLEVTQRDLSNAHAAL